MKVLLLQARGVGDSEVGGKKEILKESVFVNVKN